MSVIRWYMPFRDGVHSARVQHVHYAYAQALSPSGKLGASDTKFGTLTPFT